MRRARRGRCWSLVLLCGVLAGPAWADEATLARQARDVLNKYCYRCHGREGSAKGGLNFILERDKLVTRHKIVPGDANASPVYRRTRAGEMPPESAAARPDDVELAVLRRWIEAGAPAAEPAAARREFISEVDTLYAVLADLKAVEPRHRRFQRYFTLANLANAGAPEAALQAGREALSKLLNSLSWHPRVTTPRPVDAARTLFRIDLRDYQWTAQSWSRLLAAYPHVLPQKNAVARALAAATGTELAYLRADWFVANASRPPLYHDLLQLPLTDRDLERLLRVDVARDLQDETAARAGFNGSGVARNNRLLERHDAGYGAYWRSYDFSEGTGRQNLFEHPLGPLGANRFVHAGGEMIFNLPNGLQGYLIVDANGRRLDRAPVEIVSDPNRPDRQVETGLSCLSCHVRGLHPKDDQVRAHVEKNQQAFSADDRAAVRALYPPEAQFHALLEEDVQRFLKALARTGARVEPEPVLAVTLRYEGDLDLAAAAAELGDRPEDFAAKLGRSQSMGRTLGPLNVPGGTVQRQTFLDAWPDLLRELRPGDGPTPTPGGEVADLLMPASPAAFQGHQGHVWTIAFSPDGRRAVSGSEDRTARLWDVATGREVRPLEGHSDEVLAVAVSPDGRQALTGSTDRTLRLWDLSSGRELWRLTGHTERVSSVAFSPDGRRALSGSWDQAVSLWDLERGQELRRLSGHASYVTAVAFAPDGKTALSASYDRTVRLWDLETGREVRRFEGHTKEVYSVAFSPDGKTAATGGNDQAVRLWDVGGGQELRVLAGHDQAVVRVAFSPDGRAVLSGSSHYQGEGNFLRAWDAATGRELSRLGPKAETVWGVAFSPDGRHALTGTSGKGLRLWRLPMR